MSTFQQWPGNQQNPHEPVPEPQAPTWVYPPSVPPAHRPEAWQGSVNPAAPRWPDMEPVPAAARNRWWTRGRARLWVALGLVLALVGGLATWELLPQRPTPVADRAPFFLAVAALMREPAIHYSGSVPGSGASWEMEATSGGQQLGTITFDGQQISVLVVGGQTYLKPPASLLDSLLPSGESADPVQGEWITGVDGLTDMLPSSLSSPLKLASTLFSALEQSTDFPVAGTPAGKVDGTAAESVTTPLGVLTVSASSPYRVISLSSATAVGKESGSTTAATAAAAEIGGPTVADYIARAASDDVDGGGQTSFSQMSASDDSQLLNTLEGDTTATKGALDAAVTTQVQGQGTLGCSASGCVVTDEISSTTTGAAGAQLSGTVAVHMTATVTVQGEAAGECEADTSMAVDSSVSADCDDTQAGAVIEQDQAQAQQEADESGESVDQILDCEASVEVYAEASVDETEVEQEVADEKAEQKAAQAAADEQETAPGDASPSDASPGDVSPNDATALDDAMAQADGDQSVLDSAPSASPDLESDIEQLGASGSYNILLGISSPAFEALTQAENLENLMKFGTQDARDLFLMILYGNPDANWAVSLADFAGDGVENQFMQAVSVGTNTPNNSVTQWEMAQLYFAKGEKYGNNTLGDITFYGQNGEKELNPWAPSKD